MSSDRVMMAVFGVVFPLIGVGLLAGAVFVYVSGERAREAAVITPGTVVGIAESYDENGAIYAPVVRFATIGGEAVEFTGSTWSRPAEYQPGDTVQVIYQPGDPSSAEVDTAFGRYGAAAILGGIGVLFTAIWAIVAFALRRVLFASPPAAVAWGDE